MEIFPERNAYRLNLPGTRRKVFVSGERLEPYVQRPEELKPISPKPPKTPPSKKANESVNNPISQNNNDSRPKRDRKQTEFYTPYTK